jgi:hypothetical protein
MNKLNNELFRRLFKLFNEKPDVVKEHQVELLSKTIYKNNDIAFYKLLSQYLDYDFDYDKIIIHENPKDYLFNHYYLNIKTNDKKLLEYSIKNEIYKPYELLVHDELEDIGEVLPRLSYFDKPFKYLALYKDNKMISKVSPQEINAMKKDIDEAKGNVLVIGLGLGYFPYMVSLKDDVNHIDVIEEDINVINIFNKVLFKQFQNKNKINILEGNIKSSQLELDKYDYIYVNSYNNFSQAIDVYNLFNENDKYKKLKNIHFYLLKSIKLLK